MDPRFLEYYNNELRYFRRAAGEFALEYPKIAGRLALDPDGKEICPDPYVERLLEGVAFLAARVQLKLDAEFPRFTQSLLGTIYPDLLAPVPSMAIVKFDIAERDTALAKGPHIKAGTTLRGILGKGDITPCTFRTAHDVRLLPIRIEDIRYHARDLATLNLPRALNAKAALRIRLRSTTGATFDKIALDPLHLYVSAPGNLGGLLYEHLVTQQLGLAIHSPANAGKHLGFVPPADALHRIGHEDRHALLPPDRRTFSGYRLLREYFALPQRYLFLELSHFAHTLPAATADTTLDLILPLAQADPRLEGAVDRTCFDLHCTPAINLFPKTLDPITIDEKSTEFHIVPDRNRPLDYEIYQLTRVEGIGETTHQRQTFHPFHATKSADTATAAYYTPHRQPRTLTAREKQYDRKSDYTGTEIYLTLVDPNNAPYHPQLRQLHLAALCTNRHLPLSMAIGATAADFTLETAAPVTGARCLVAPTEPRPTFATDGRLPWRLINHLSLNYRSLLGENGGDSAGTLREILKLYAGDDRALLRHADGLVAAAATPALRRSPTPGPVSFLRGTEVTLEFDETPYEGIGPFILATVLDQFISKYASINSFTETRIRTLQRGEIARLTPTPGRRPTL